MAKQARSFTQYYVTKRIVCVLSQVGASAAPAAHGRLRSVSPGYGSAGYLAWSTTAPPGTKWLVTEFLQRSTQLETVCCVLLDAERGEAACGVSVPVLCGCLTRVIAAAPAVVVCAQSGEMCVGGVGDVCVWRGECGGERRFSVVSTCTFVYWIFIMVLMWSYTVPIL